MIKNEKIYSALYSTTATRASLMKERERLDAALKELAEGVNEELLEPGGDEDEDAWSFKDDDEGINVFFGTSMVLAVSDEGAYLNRDGFMVPPLILQIAMDIQKSLKSTEGA